MLKKTAIVAAACAIALTGTTAEARKAKPAPQIERTSANPNSPIANSASLPAESRIFFISGTTPSPPDPAKPDDLGDTRQQTLSVLTKIKTQLESMGLGMGDVVKMTVFLVGVPDKGGRMDSAAMNEVFRTFFGTPEQPNKPTRSTIQVAALGRPTMYVEIEAVAAKAP
ncbi:MAG: endonuclease (mRNA) endoribonuclease [Pseudomonadota bacterium]|jgi:enamine deaminase RidA (YjgF/YER057c/UK114 family)